MNTALRAVRRNGKRAAALAAVAAVSLAWTATLLGAGGSTAASSAVGEEPREPPAAGPDVPVEAIEAPASVSGDRGPGEGRDLDAAEILATSSANGIPSSALAAYQRAETVINSADKACNLTWQLVAAIGRVESNHGRFGGNALDDQGLARPGIYGVALNGKKNTSVIRDTDAGQLDKDTTYDRAVGPMQFIPSTWSVVGVDADNDGQRNPQDIDDAALATAVYLCSGSQSSGGDLSTVAGQRAAVYRYNHSTSYVDLVLRIMNNYLAGDFSSVPDGTTAAGLLVPEPAAPGRTPQRERAGRGADEVETEYAPTDPAPTPEPDDVEQKTERRQKGSENVLPRIKIPPLPSTQADPVDDVLTLAQAVVQCALDGVSKLNLTKWNACLRGHTE